LSYRVDKIVAIDIQQVVLYSVMLPYSASLPSSLVSEMLCTISRMHA